MNPKEDATMNRTVTVVLMAATGLAAVGLAAPAANAAAVAPLSAREVTVPVVQNAEVLAKAYARARAAGKSRSQAWNQASRVSVRWGKSNANISGGGAGANRRFTQAAVYEQVFVGAPDSTGARTQVSFCVPVALSKLNSGHYTTAATGVAVTGRQADHNGRCSAPTVVI
ncbi:MAG: hypothetical protein WCP28_03380 [Actinomycetes bacterium]